MKRILSTLMVVTLVLVSTTSCSLIKNLVPKASENSIATEESSDSAGKSGGKLSNATDVSEENIDKYNAYIDLKNNLNSGFYSSIDRYFGEFDFSETFVKPEDSISSPMNPISETGMDNAFSYVSEKPEYPGVDSAVTEMHKLYIEIAKLSKEIDDYYAAKTYVDDNYAKAEEMHVALYKNVVAFDEQYTIFGDSFASIITASHDKEKNTAKEEGNLITYYSLCFMDDCRALFDEIDAQGITDENLITLNMDAFRPLYDQLTADFTQLQTNLKDDAMLEKEGFSGTVLTFNVKSYNDSTVDLKGAMASIIERVEKQEPLSEVDLMLADNQSLTSPDGSLGKVYYLYSEMISNYNNMLG